ncbi:dolichyl pyrophosphate Man9GlcNAc2 alpha-1,3-glucosyltransferase [Dermacentor andersoni]|uniref:dolichyl pyrophosphate Man9GlcNAc2 alpha-1,3-glucosyltransferase n=1 Tax=Dermacentor andersoni TaxID=34620 RepID=UPI003B3ACD12
MIAGDIDDVCYFGVLTALLLRSATSLWPYSGAGKPPMFGDYEAQRHWQEVTVNLPVTKWYENSTDNDLLYWGLDYPPLTAYHSWLCGKVAEVINGSWVALSTSRGTESYDHKLFMRYTVLAADVLVYFPAVLFFWNSLWSPVRMKPRDVAIASTLTLIVPGLVLIDHGHFQYNCVSLGLALAAVAFVERESPLLSAVAFSLALNYKQMALYYAIPFFCYLLGCCFQQRGLGYKLRLFLGLALAVSATFGVCWAPYLGSPDRALQVVRRLFPLDRGLFEDKVANIWCTLSIVIKLKNLYSPTVLALVSGLVTLGTASISAVDVLLRPMPERFRFSLINCSLAFFLCSYQVHEKTILFPALAFYLILHKHPGLVVWFSTVATFSMFPLLHKDGLATPYIALVVLNLVFVYQAYLKDASRSTRVTLLFVLSLAGCVALNLLHLTMPPPARYPDLHQLLNAAYSCGHFLLFLIYTHYLQFQLPASRFTKIKKK